MTLTQAKQELTKLGFTFTSEKFGTMDAEPYTNDLIENNHWTPKYRSVYIAHDYPNGPYITSDIHGKYRTYKARKYNEYPRVFANVFAYGDTLEQAIKNFINCFEKKIYNAF